MQALLTLIQQHTRDIALRSAIARHNLEGAATDADAIAQAVEKREAGRWQWSMFTPDSGRPQ